ncbi:unnamed protein product [Pleuronectes platessa]|uniref:Uncharacterized protein n=1 Tax=Pleuronectes platessa TaxID=8262 RepID=A0A9N7V679_PLEPL|nr:unnamed protein product [Pleuronectes platessa]
MSFISEKYLVRTVFLVDHPSQHPTAELAELGGTGVGLREDSQPCVGIPASVHSFTCSLLFKIYLFLPVFCGLSEKAGFDLCFPKAEKREGSDWRRARGRSCRAECVQRRPVGERGWWNQEGGMERESEWAVWIPSQARLDMECSPSQLATVDVKEQQFYSELPTDVYK